MTLKMTKKEAERLWLRLLWGIGMQFNESDSQINKMYHYTTPKGLMKILTQNEISLWFTKHDCLNDISEGTEMTTHYQAACNQLKYKKIKDESAKKFYDFIVGIKPSKKQIIHYSTDTNITATGLFECDAYICCFSENPNSLDLWRYYSKNKQYEGYSIGFKYDLFTNIKNVSWYKIKNNKYKLEQIKVIYDSDKKKEYYRNIINQCYKLYEAGISLRKVGVILENALLNTQLIFKHECFASEKEVRAILYIPKEKSGYDIQYRTRNGFVIPYIEEKFDKKYLSDITIGPLINDEIAKNNLEQYLKSNGYKNVQIQKSGLPIRF